MILLFLWPNKLLTKICWMKSWRRQPNKRMLQRRKSSCLAGKLRVFGSKRWSHFRIKPPQNIQDKFERTQFVHLKHMFCKSFITQLSYCGFHKLLSRCWGPLCYIMILGTNELQSLPLFQEALSTQTVDDYFAKNPALREKIDDEIRNHNWDPKVSTTVSWLCTIKATFIYHLLWLTKERKTYYVPHMHIHRNDAKVASCLLLIVCHIIGEFRML